MNSLSGAIVSLVSLTIAEIGVLFPIPDDKLTPINVYAPTSCVTGINIYPDEVVSLKVYPGRVNVEG